jgi:hypothetical protein
MKQRLKPSQPVMVPRASDWVPPEKRDTAWWLFKEKFHCRVQRIQTISIEEMKEYGTPTSGDPNFDAQMRNERQDRMLSVVQMIEYWENGITVGVVNEVDTKRIYEYVVNHLTAWKHRIEYELNVRGAPLDELIKLDKFANVVYKHARYHFTQDYVDSLLARKVQGARANRNTIMKPFVETQVINGGAAPAEQTDAQKALAEKYPDRVGMADAFKRGQATTINGGPVRNTRWQKT